MNTIFINFYQVKVNENFEIIDKTKIHSFDISKMNYSFNTAENSRGTEYNVNNTILGIRDDSDEGSKVMEMYLIAKDLIKAKEPFIIEYNLNSSYSLFSPIINDINYVINPNNDSVNGALLESIHFNINTSEG